MTTPNDAPRGVVEWEPEVMTDMRSDVHTHLRSHPSIAFRILPLSNERAIVQYVDDLLQAARDSADVSKQMEARAVAAESKLTAIALLQRWDFDQHEGRHVRDYSGGCFDTSDVFAIIGDTLAPHDATRGEG